MGWLFVLLMLGGVAAYVMKPDERLHVARTALRPIEDFWFAYQNDRARPDEFRDALRARTRWPIVTGVILAAQFAVFAASPYAHPGFFATLVEIAGVIQPALLVEGVLGHTALGVLFFSGAAVGSVMDFARQPLVPTLDPTGGVLAVYGAVLAIVARGLLRRSAMTVPLRTLRRFVPGAAVVTLYALWTGALTRPSGVVPLGLGFIFGFLLARHMADSRARVDRVAAVTVATAIIVAAVGVPLRGIVDARPDVARAIAVEDRTAADYGAAIQQFKLGALRAEPIAQLIERQIEPEIDQLDARFKALGRVPAEQQALVAAAGEYIALRRESWQLRAKAFHKSNMRLLRDADEKERAALGALDRLR